jgi:pantoate--beta-alanine ligase
MSAMNVIVDPAELQQKLAELRAQAATLAFVPTMGALHEGHLSLVKLARKHADKVAVSIFVNPMQFGPTEDFRVYPRQPEKDCELLASAGTDLVFMPTEEVIYPQGWAVTVHPGPVGAMFEGKSRPGHFQGVLTVVAKLFHLVQPNVAVFGQKDAQQLFLIRRMVEDLHFPVRIIEGETVREADGLAFSSRNVMIKNSERPKATVLYRALLEGERLLDNGERSSEIMKQAMQSCLESVPEFRSDYATVVSEQSFTEIDPVPGEARLIIAGHFSAVRLIDNLKFNAT